MSLLSSGAARGLAIALSAFAFAFASASTPPNETAKLPPSLALTFFSPHPDSAVGTAVVVCPGGAYGILAKQKEGVEPSLWLRSLGVHAFLLDYPLGPQFHHPAQLKEAKRAMRWVRANAQRFHIDPNRIGLLGFSAGGHLSATVATHYDGGTPNSLDPLARVSCRPNFHILVYPVISMRQPFTHRASRTNLLGRFPDTATLDFLSPELHVNASTPPAFIVHAKNDPVVAFANSQVYVDALRRAQVPVAFLAFAQGTHGFGLATEKNGQMGQGQLATWPSHCEKWLNTGGFLGKTRHAP